MRITVEPSGAVSASGVEFSNMDAPEFSSQVVDRVKKFNFGPKEGVSATTILFSSTSCLRGKARGVA